MAAAFSIRHTPVRRVKAGIIALVLGVGALTGCEKSPPPALRIGVVEWLGQQPLALAAERGWFAGAPVKLIDYPAGTQVQRALRNGVIEAAVVTLDEMILLSQSVPDILTVLVLDISHGCDVVLARSPIAAMSGLRGKRIGYESQAVGSFVLARALDRSGLRPEDVTLVPLPSDQHEKSFRSGEVDAIVTFEPAASRLADVGGHVVWDSSDAPGEILDLLVVRKSYLDAHPAVVASVVEGWFKGCDFLQANPAEAHAWIASRLHLTSTQVEAASGGLRFPCRSDNRLLLGGPSPGLKATAVRVSRVMASHGLLPAGSSTGEILDPRVAAFIR